MFMQSINLLKNWNRTKKFYNHGKNIYRLFYILAQLAFITNERKLDHYHQKVNIRVGSQDTQRLTLKVLNFAGIKFSDTRHL